MRRLGTVVIFAVLVGGGALAFVQAQGQGEAGTAQVDSASATDPTAQPIAFPHDIHAGSAQGQNQIDCQYCHFSAERSVDAGIPAVSDCMGCHLVIPGTTNPQEVQKLRQYSQDGEPIPWVRIYKVPDHVHFPHMRHVQADVECQTCHGEVQEMGVIEDVAQPLAMGWCVSCHEEQEASTDCTVCHY